MLEGQDIQHPPLLGVHRRQHQSLPLGSQCHHQRVHLWLHERQVPGRDQKGLEGVDEYVENDKR